MTKVYFELANKVFESLQVRLILVQAQNHMIQVQINFQMKNAVQPNPQCNTPNVTSKDQK